MTERGPAYSTVRQGDPTAPPPLPVSHPHPPIRGRMVNKMHSQEARGGGGAEKAEGLGAKKRRRVSSVLISHLARGSRLKNSRAVKGCGVGEVEGWG